MLILNQPNVEGRNWKKFIKFKKEEKNLPGSIRVNLSNQQLGLWDQDNTMKSKSKNYKDQIPTNPMLNS